MGQKTHPIGYRLGYNVTWNSRWYAGKDYAKLLHQDIKIRKVVKARLFHAGVSKVEIERSGDQTRVIIHTARPGIIIGRKGAEVDKLKADLEKQYGGQVYITVKEIKKPELDAQLVSENVATQLETGKLHEKTGLKMEAQSGSLRGRIVFYSINGEMKRGSIKICSFASETLWTTFLSEISPRTAATNRISVNKSHNLAEEKCSCYIYHRYYYLFSCKCHDIYSTYGY